jgi:hypothetical protein
MEDNMPIKKEKEGIFVLAINLLLKLLEFLTGNKKKKEEEKRRTEIAFIKEQLKKSLAEGRIQDAAYWKNKLIQLYVVSLLIMSAFISGCTTKQTPSTQTMVIGERIVKVSPGNVITVPPLIKPAKQWYLIDNEGLYQLIDIKFP